jgi:hypothetical protein
MRKKTLVSITGLDPRILTIGEQRTLFRMFRRDENRGTRGKVFELFDVRRKQCIAAESKGIVESFKVNTYLEERQLVALTNAQNEEIGWLGECASTFRSVINGTFNQPMGKVLRRFWSMKGRLGEGYLRIECG